MAAPKQTRRRKVIPPRKPPELAHYHAIKATEEWRKFRESVEGHARDSAAEREARRGQFRRRSERIDKRDATIGEP